VSSAMQDQEKDENKGNAGKPNPKQIKVKVSFPLAGKGAYNDKVEPSTSADVVRQAAMGHFGVADDQTATYYLTLGGQRVDAAATVGSLAGDKHELKFTLAKELIQG
jgi:hypothetical protein